ncbi:MAG: hypothetical protein V3R48_06415 [Thermoplasmata archaeon]
MILAGAMVAAGSSEKMSEDDAKKVEEAGGRPVEKMTDEEVHAAAKQEGVQIQDLTPEEKAQVEKAEAEAE